MATPGSSWKKSKRTPFLESGQLSPHPGSRATREHPPFGSQAQLSHTELQAFGGETDKLRRLTGAFFAFTFSEGGVQIHTLSPKPSRAVPVPSSPRIGLHHFPLIIFKRLSTVNIFPNKSLIGVQKKKQKQKRNFSCPRLAKSRDSLSCQPEVRKGKGDPPPPDCCSLALRTSLHRLDLLQLPRPAPGVGGVSAS